MHAVITGAAQGLGYAAAESLISNGWEVTLLDINHNLLSQTASTLGCRSFTADVTDQDSIRKFYNLLTELDALVNNAGIWKPQQLESMSVADQTHVLNTNVLGTVVCTKYALPLLRLSEQGAIVNVSSLAAQTNSPGLGLYAASKSAIETLTKQWAVELAPIRVNAVAPGLIKTEGTSENYRGKAGELRSKAVPLGRVGQPNDVAETIAFLLSESASYVSGQIVTIDGGLSAGSSKH